MRIASVFVAPLIIAKATFNDDYYDYNNNGNYN